MEKATSLISLSRDLLIGLRLNDDCNMKWMFLIMKALPTRDGFPVLEELVIEGDIGPCNRALEWIISIISTSRPLKAFSLSNTQAWILGNGMSCLSMTVTLLAERSAELGLRVLRLLDLTNCLYDDEAGLYMMFHEKLPTSRL